VLRPNSKQAVANTFDCEALVIPAVPVPLHDWAAIVSRPLPDIEDHVGVRYTDSVETVVEAIDGEALIRLFTDEVPLLQRRPNGPDGWAISTSMTFPEWRACMISQLSVTAPTLCC
jgi:hypothetical protein